MKRRHELPFGAELVGDGVRFRLWAPKARAVALRLEGQRDLEMAVSPGGWFERIAPSAGPGSRYHYVVEGRPVPDPASRFQPADVHGPSEVIDPTAYHWRDAAWRGRPLAELVFYELHTGSFSAAGNFAGIAGHLDHLIDLGVTAVELMPVADFPGRRNWGYDGVLPFAPDAQYGRPEDLKRLVDICHASGLAVFLDVVYNHFGPEGNYLHLYAPGFFTEHHTTPWGAAIAMAQPEVRQFYVENALYWLEEFHLDGLRFDAVHAIRDDSKPSILVELAETVRQRLGGDRQVHLVLENDGNEAHLLAKRLFDGQWNDDLHHALCTLTTGADDGYYADYADKPIERLGRALAEGFAYQGEASAYRSARRGEPSAHLPPTSFVAFIQNHDQVGNDAFGRRLGKRATPAAIRMAAAIYLLSPQLPLLFMGEEWGADQPFPFFCDFTGELAEAVREGRQQEFAKFAAFRDPAARARIPDPTADATFASAVLDWSAIERPEHREWLAWYRQMLRLRAAEIAPRLKGTAGHAGQWRPLAARALAVMWRLGDGSRLSLFANFAETPVAPEARPAGRILYASHTESGAVLPPLSVLYALSPAA